MDNIDKNEIRRAIDRLQEEHPAHFAFDVTLFNHDTDFDVIQRAIDMVAKKCQDDADIHIICEMAKLYLDGVKPTLERPHGEWIYHKEWEVDGECAFECSKCGMGTDVDYNFCPNCGADMRKEGDEK